jgi:hypothetical protein
MPFSSVGSEDDAPDPKLHSLATSKYRREAVDLGSENSSTVHELVISRESIEVPSVRTRDNL